MNGDVSLSQSTITTTPIELPDSEPQALDDEIQIISSQDKCVSLDDDSDVMIEENVVIDIDSDDLEIIESNNTPIVIDDEDQNCVINPLNIIQKKQGQLFDIVCRENSSLAEVIEEAINLDTSGSMKRIIHRMLIPLYLNCSKSFKESQFFKNTLQITLTLLETAPHLKYSHIKSLCESLKSSIIKKKAPLARKRTQVQTSKSTLKKRKYKRKNFTKHKRRKIDKTNIIHTKQNKKKDGVESTSSMGNKTSHTLIEIEIPSITSVSPSSNKENTEIDIPTTNERLYNNYDNKALTDTTNNTEIDANNLLRPLYVVNTQITPPDIGQQTVEKLENQIAMLKKDLEKVEEQEVTDDNLSSPYLIAETIKAKIVKLYKQLCDMTGTESTKRHEVKLQVVNGHPPGPARCLQKYINDNIDECGNPPFPDIFEVVRCVERAVEEDHLKWNRKQIVAEAQVLLKHYGHAIQKRRKKREWRDVVSLCKEELVDPADFDPTLEAKLLENSRIARRNEDEILDRYVRLERENSNNPAFTLSVETAVGDSDTDIDEDIHGARHNTSKENNIQEAPCPNMADSTTEEVPSPTMAKSTTNLENSINKQGNSSTNIQESNIQHVLYKKNDVKINQQGDSSIVSAINVMKSNIQSASNVINTKNNQCNQKESSFINPTTDLTSNLEYCPILIVNSANNLLPNLHGSICFINSRPVFATRLQNCPTFIKSTNNLEGNLQNGQSFMNNLTGSLQNGLSFINSSNNLEGNQQSLNSLIITSNDNFEGNQQNCIINTSNNLQNGSNLINSSNNFEGNQQNCPSIKNTSNKLENNLQSGPFINSTNKIEEGKQQNRANNFVNISNNFDGKLQNGSNLINSSKSLEGDLKSGHNSINPSNEGNQQSSSIINTSNNFEGNLLSGPNNKEGNLQTNHIDSTTEIQSSVTHIGNIEYNRTIIIDSTGSDTKHFPCQRKGQTDIVNHTNTVIERDTNDTDEIECKIKVKQEEDDVMKLLSELGSDCVATVFDIEDPFLVIEISDSSDDEE